MGSFPSKQTGCRLLFSKTTVVWCYFTMAESDDSDCLQSGDTTTPRAIFTKSEVEFLLEEYSKHRFTSEQHHVPAHVEVGGKMACNV